MFYYNFWIWNLHDFRNFKNASRIAQAIFTSFYPVGKIIYYDANSKQTVLSGLLPDTFVLAIKIWIIQTNQFVIFA